MFVSKDKLCCNGHILPNGRKVYLPHHESKESRHCAENRKSPFWKSNNDDKSNLKVRCAPVESGQEFLFHVDFDNLSINELYLLMQSLELSDSPTVRYRLGMGKPLGLGSIELAVGMVALYPVGDGRRYLDELTDHCLEESWIRTGWLKESYRELIFHRYPESFASIDSATPVSGWQDIDRFNDVKHPYSLVDQGALESFQFVNDAGSVKKKVMITYPVVKDHYKEKCELNNEEELYKWFSKNSEEKVMMEPIRYDDPKKMLGKLPILPGGK